MSYYGPDVVNNLLNKTRALVACLLAEKAAEEAAGEIYICAAFGRRRDVVPALIEVLAHRPATRDVFTIGSPLGTSESTHRHSMMDGHRTQARAQGLAGGHPRRLQLGREDSIHRHSRRGGRVDVQAYGSVICWDLPPNIARWAQGPRASA